MSIPWYAVKTKDMGIESVHMLREDAIDEAASIVGSSGELGFAQVVEVRIVENVEECESEKNGFNGIFEVGVFEWDNFTFCPYCGRKMKS